MTISPLKTGTASDRSMRSSRPVTASCADFCAGARHGRYIEGHHREQAIRLDPDRERLARTRSGIAPAALNGLRN